MKKAAALLAFVFFINSVFPSPVLAQNLLALPAPGTMVQPSAAFTPACLKGVKVDINNPFVFDFIVDKGQSDLDGQALSDESNLLIKYFLTALTVPEKETWVNLSPYEQNRIIPDALGKTEMGRDMLAQDYLLKQLTASLVYPESVLGKEFWAKVYAEAQAKLGTTDIPQDTFNKVWIMPDKISLYETGSGVYIVKHTLKVLTEQDYLAIQNNKSDTPEIADATTKTLNDISTRALREVILPAITKEVNEGKNFAPLRQVYDSLLLAAWYKIKVKDSLLNGSFANKNKVAGDELADKTEKDQVYQRYVEAFKKGVYNYIKEDIDKQSNEVIPRKYFSGGEIGDTAADVKNAERLNGLPPSAAANTVAAHVDIRTSIHSSAAQYVDRAQRPTFVQDNINIILQELSAKAPLKEQLAVLLKRVQRNEFKEQDVFKLITSLRNCLSWWNGDAVAADINETLQDIVKKSVEGRPEKEKKSAQVRIAFLGALMDLGLSPDKVSLQKIWDDKSYFGAARVGNVLYVEKAMTEHILKMTHAHERLRALFVRALASTPDDGVMIYWNRFCARNGRDKALRYYGLNPQEDPREIIQNMEKSFYKDASDSVYQQLEAKAKELGMQLPESKGVESKQLLNDMVRFTRWSSTEYLMHIISGDFQKGIRAVFPGSGNPTTVAHITAILGLAALSGGEPELDLTPDDNRKPVLTQNKPDREEMNVEIVKGLPQIIFDTKVFSQLRLNGEQRTDQRMSLSNGGVEPWYFFGSDHFKSIDGFTKVGPENAEELWAMYRKPGVIYLMKSYLEHKDFYKLTPEQTGYLETIIAALESAEYKEVIMEKKDTHYIVRHKNGQRKHDIAVFRQWLTKSGITYLPNFDTVARQWLNNHSYYGGRDWKIGLGVGPRTPIIADPIRDAMIEGTLKVDGKIIGRPMRMLFVPMPESMNIISSTASRDALLELLLYGKLSQANEVGFYSVPVAGWLYILSHPEYQRSLLDKQKMPFSAEVLGKKNGQQALEDLKALLPNYELSIMPLLITKPNGSGFEIDSYELRLKHNEHVYSVQVRSSMEFNVGENDEVKVTMKHLFLESSRDTTGLPDDVVATLKAFNGINAAEKTADASEVQRPQGGINLDLGDAGMDIQSEGSGIRFNIDPAQIQAGNYDGLVPVIRSITPVMNVPAFL
ncbi:MAG: hypothetical protein HQL22_11085, partial [Candidatus Omnitrophica bacterium]|nr:hypothetical protein [Candidatus Omnitrophota bacterium]